VLTPKEVIVIKQISVIFFISTLQFLKKYNATYEQKYMKIRVPHAIRVGYVPEKISNQHFKITLF
jgi:hypothetical protein